MREERLTLPIRGLVYAGCVPELEQALSRQEGVLWAKVNYAAEQITVVYDPAVFDVAALIWAAEEQGCAVDLGPDELAELRTTFTVPRHTLAPEFVRRVLHL